MWRRTFQVVLVVFFIIAVVLTSVTVADHEHPRPTSDNYSSSNGRAAVATQERTFFPILGVPNRIKAGHLTKGHGGAPKPSAQVGYPAPRPPRPPIHSYGPPNKPSTGYPGSNHQVQEVYITYPPTAGSASYPSGNYGPTTSVYPVTASLPSQGYLPSASLPPKPLYERPPVSYPSPNYEPPAISYPQPPPINPDYSAPSKPSPAYPGGSYAPAPSHPAATGTGSYAPTPNYPAGGSYNPPLASSYPSSGSYAPATSYPASTGSSSYNPSPASSYPSGGGSYAPATSYPAASGGGTYRPPPLPSYPGTSGSYHPPSSHPGPSYAPVFVFIPKPGAFPNAVPAQKPVYQPSYPPVRPPPLRPQNQQQYYPAPIKPPHKPSGSYPAAKPPSTSYGLPKAQPITTSNSAYRTDRFNNNDAASKVVLQKQKPQITYQSISSSNWPPPTVVPAPSSISNQNTLFQRGNAPDTIKNTQFSKQIPSTQTGSSSLFNRTNLLLGAESIETPSVAVLPANINPSLPFFREELLNRRPVRPNFQNDCGGSWIILDGPTGGKLIDPTEIQIEPISSFDSPTGRFPNNDIKNWNDRPDDSFVTFPPGFNDVPKSTLRPDLEFLIFSTTPSPSDINDNTLVSTTGWRKPTPSSILSNRPAQSETVTPLFNSQVVSNGFVIRNTANRPFHTLTSTENSIIFSSFITNESDGSSSNQLDNPTPLSVNTADTEISIAKSVGQNKKNRTAEEIQQLFDGETTNSIIRLLREANLKAISALMDQAEIATLIQDQGCWGFFLVFFFFFIFFLLSSSLFSSYTLLFVQTTLANDFKTIFLFHRFSNDERGNDEKITRCLRQATQLSIR